MFAMKICPNCQRNVAKEEIACSYCGVIFSKWTGTRRVSPALAAHETLIGEPPTLLSEEILLRIVFRGLIFLILAYYAWTLLILRTPTSEIFLHHIDLPFHEAGHFFFTFGGQILTLMGGGIMQVLMPSLVFGHFLYRSDYLGSAATLFWIGENLLDVSYYVGDARAMELQLIGCEEPPCENHDWHQILGSLGILQWDTFISRILFGVGSVFMVTALIACGFLIWQALNLKTKRLR
jgi:hypothetical protein